MHDFGWRHEHLILRPLLSPLFFFFFFSLLPLPFFLFGCCYAFICRVKQTSALLLCCFVLWQFGWMLCAHSSRVARSLRAFLSVIFLFSAFSLLPALFFLICCSFHYFTEVVLSGQCDGLWPSRHKIGHNDMPPIHSACHSPPLPSVSSLIRSLARWYYTLEIPLADLDPFGRLYLI